MGRAMRYEVNILKRTISKLKRENKVLRENTDNTCRNYNVISKRLDRVSDNYAKAEAERVRLFNMLEKVCLTQKLTVKKK